MRSFKNLFLHRLNSPQYSLVKYLSSPFSNFLRHLVACIFTPCIHKNIVVKVFLFFPWNVQIVKKSSLNSGVTIDG